MRKFISIFLYAFLLNLVWENLHKFLYVHYQNGEITQLVLLRAAIMDAIMISILIFVVTKLLKIFNRSLLIIIFGIIIAIVLETWALGAGRWLYKDIMPIIPVINTGLTPTIQLGLTGFVTYVLVFKKR